MPSKPVSPRGSRTAAAAPSSLPVRLRAQAVLSSSESDLLHPSTLLVVLGLYRALAVLDRNQSEELKPMGLNPSQFNALNVLHRASQPLTMKQLTEMMAMQPTNVSVIVRALRERGFAQQTLNGSDMRSLLVSITPAGQKFLDKVLPSHWAYLERLMHGMEPPDREQLVELLQRLANSVRECEGQVAAAAERTVPVQRRRNRPA